MSIRPVHMAGVFAGTLDERAVPVTALWRLFDFARRDLMRCGWCWFPCAQVLRLNTDTGEADRLCAMDEAWGSAHGNADRPRVALPGAHDDAPRPHGRRVDQAIATGGLEDGTEAQGSTKGAAAVPVLQPAASAQQHGAAGRRHDRDAAATGPSSWALAAAALVGSVGAIAVRRQARHRRRRSHASIATHPGWDRSRARAKAAPHAATPATPPAHSACCARCRAMCTCARACAKMNERIWRQEPSAADQGTHEHRRHVRPPRVHAQPRAQAPAARRNGWRFAENLAWRVVDRVYAWGTSTGGDAAHAAVSRAQLQRAEHGVRSGRDRKA